ncbi:MAG: hypothetical protein JJT96_13525 [Opitutales bacterium]|nr:hypothetical protein [Opitutales bacterium]
MTTPSTGAISFDGIATLSNPGPGYQNGITENSARTRMSVSDIGSSPVSVIWAREVNLGSFDKNPSATAIELVPGKTYRLLISMSIDGNNWSGNYTLETRFNNTGLMITPNPDTGGFAGWAVLEDLPPERRGPLDTNGPLALPNLLAFAMGLNPLTATAVDLPRASPINTQSETVSFRYRRAKNAPGISLKPLVSADFISWQDVSGGDVAVLADDGEAELVELTLPNPAEGLLFLRLEAEEIP